MGFSIKNKVMKKYIMLASLSLLATISYAQQDLNSASDAVRFSVDNLTGSARFRAMSGAFGALGGDPSAIMVNPAGSAVFNYNSGTASLSSYNTNNNSNYFGTRTKKNDNSFDLNQIGAVFVFNNNNPEATVNKFTLGFNYENTNNFDNSIYSQGTNPTNSVDSYFISYANGTTLSTLDNSFYDQLSFREQQAYLGYNAYVFNPVADVANNTNYVSNYDNAANNFYHENRINSSGYKGKVALNFAAQLKKIVYLGATINVHFTDHIKTTNFYEDANTPSGLNAIRFNNERYTYGGGVSFGLGSIVKITEQLRAGVAYESPTWLRLQDEIRQNVVSYGTTNGTVIVDPFATYILDDYTVKTPSKWTGSLAYVFGKNGLLSMDYSYKDHSNTEYVSNGYDAINTELSNTLTAAGELRIGAEYRIKNVSLRGGYRYEESPYKNGYTMGDLTGYSGGIGFTFNNSRFDLAYSWSQREMDVQFFNAGLIDPARVKSTNNDITLSYTLDL